jgi:hypothetical protein
MKRAVATRHLADHRAATEAARREQGCAKIAAVGRPAVITPRIETQLKALLNCGVTQERAALAVGVSRRTVQRFVASCRQELSRRCWKDCSQPCRHLKRCSPTLAGHVSDRLLGRTLNCSLAVLTRLRTRLRITEKGRRSNKNRSCEREKCLQVELSVFALDSPIPRRAQADDLVDGTATENDADHETSHSRSTHDVEAC